MHRLFAAVVASVVVLTTACTRSSSPRGSVPATNSHSAHASTSKVTSSVACSTDASPPARKGHNVDVSGHYVWRQFDSAFYVTQLGTCVYYFAQNVKNTLDPHPTGAGFAGVFVGDLSRDLTIHGYWGDVPLGAPDCCGGGTLTWKVTGSPGHYVFDIVARTGDWSADSIIETKP